MSAAIQVLEVRPVAGHGNLRPFAKVRLGAVVIHGCRVIQQPGQKPWVALPQGPARKKADGSGSGWYPVVEITRKELLDQVRAAVVAAWQEDASPAGTGRTAVHKVERRAPREATTEEWAPPW